MIRTVARRCRGGHAPVRLLLIIAAGLLPLFTFYGTLARAMGDVVFSGAGDIADCLSSGDEATASLLDTLPGHVFTLGDNAYENGTDAEYANCYEPSWGRHKARTYPSAGNHEYNTPGATGYYNYFGAAAGESGKGYYSYDLGTWHIVVLNSNCASIGGCQAGSPQEQWAAGRPCRAPRSLYPGVYAPSAL